MMKVVDVNGKFVIFDGMTWPMTGALGDLQYTLRYGTPTTPDLLRAAGVCAAYTALVAAPERKRRIVIRALRKAAEVTR